MITGRSVNTYKSLTKKTTKKLRSETNDCSVRASAVAFNIDYAVAHEWLRVVFKRPDREGVFFAPKIGKVTTPTGAIVKRRCDLFRIVGSKDRRTRKNITVYRFMLNIIESKNRGTFFICVRGHVFAVKDGVIYGNPQDATKLKVPIIDVYEVIDRRNDEEEITGCM